MGNIKPADKVELSVGKISKLQCADGKKRIYLWDNEFKGFGVIATDTGGKSFILQTKLYGKSVRFTIGKVNTWQIPEARAEARRLQVLIDKGTDPRQEAAKKKAENQSAAAAMKEQEIREKVTFGRAWEKYLIARKRFWGDRHYRDHEEMIQLGGEKRARSRQLTEPGVLASLVNIRLMDLTTETIQEWATKEAETRPGRARIGFRLLKVFLTWCTEQLEFRQIVTYNPAKNKRTREILGKPKTIDVVLQREQLPAWFNAIKQIRNPVISAYFQCLLLIGTRPNALIELKWEDIDFQWRHITIRDKVEGSRVIPLTPYIWNLLENLPRRNEWIFRSPTSASGHLIDLHQAHRKACSIAGIDGLTIYALRGSFASFSEWVETPAGIAAQIQGHKPSGIRERHYIRRELDLLRMWHTKIEAWILKHAEIEYVTNKSILRAVTAT